MALRKANAYSHRHVVPFTRVSKKKSKAYIKVVPPQNIVKFSMGRSDLFNQGKLPHQLTMLAEQKVQIRHNALESCRQYLNKVFDVDLAGIYLLKVIPYPHHIQRENKMLTGAGADRMQTGMQLSFGKSVGKAAIVKPGDRIFFVAVQNEKAVEVVRNAFQEIKSKLPGKKKVAYEKVEKIYE